MPITLERQIVLDFDIENRPLTYGGGDFTFSEVTAIAAAFTDSPGIGCMLLGQDEPADMLKWFHILYDAADIVTGTTSASTIFLSSMAL